MENTPPTAPVPPNADVYCPGCGLPNPPHTLHCICGYPLQAGLGVPGQSWSNTAEANRLMLPQLHWGVLVLLSVITCGIFLLFWGIRQGFWARKAEPGNNALIYYGVFVVATVVEVVFDESQELKAVGLIARLIGNISFLLGSFSVKSAIESHLDKRLSGLMTFFFGPIYNQYKLNEGRKDSLSILNAP